jgi:hypothetical protein
MFLGACSLGALRADRECASSDPRGVTRGAPVGYDEPPAASPREACRRTPRRRAGSPHRDKEAHPGCRPDRLKGGGAQPEDRYSAHDEGLNRAPGVDTRGDRDQPHVAVGTLRDLGSGYLARTGAGSRLLAAKRASSGKSRRCTAGGGEQRITVSR